MNIALIGFVLGACAQVPPDHYRVGVYYYPWHADNFHGHNYLRQHRFPRSFLNSANTTTAIRESSGNTSNGAGMRP